jgi:hypothetical protein
MAPIAEAWVRIRPQFTDFRGETERIASRESDRMGVYLGKTLSASLSKTLGDELAKSSTRIGAQVSRSFVEAFDRGLSGNAKAMFGSVRQEAVRSLGDAGRNGGKAFGDSFARDVSDRLRDSHGRFASALGADDSGGNSSWRRMGLTVGVSTAQGFFAALSASFKAPPPQVSAGVGVLVAAVAPTLGAGIAGAVVGGIGTGGMVGGMVLASRDPRIKSAGKDLGAFILGDLEDRAEDFVEPMLGGIEQVKRTWLAMGPDLDRIFDADRFVAPLTQGVTQGMQKVISGAADAVAKADPVIVSFANGVDRIGEAVGNSFSLFARDAKEGASAVDDLTGSVAYFVESAAGMVHVLAQVKGGLDGTDYWIDRIRYFLEDGASKSHAFAKGIDLTADGFKKGTPEAEAYRRVTLGTATAADYALLKQVGMTKGLDGTTSAYLEQAAAAQTTKEKTEALAAAQLNLKGAFEALAPGVSFNRQLVEGLRQAQDLLFGSTIRLNEANEAYEAAWDSLSGAIKTNGGTLDIHTEKGRANRDMLQAVLKSLGDQYFQEIETGVSISDATKKHEGRIAALRTSLGQTSLNKAETDKLIKTYGQIPPSKGTNMLVTGMNRIVDALYDLYLYQRSLAEGKTIEQIRGGLGRSAEAIKGKYALGGKIFGPGTKTSDSIPILASRGEFMQPAHAVDYYGVKAMEAIRHHRIPQDVLESFASGSAKGLLSGFAAGGYLDPLFGRDWGKTMRFALPASATRLPSRSEVASKVAPAFGPWPSSPGAQRGDSGVWRSILRLVQQSGIPYKFGNAFRPGDPLWHGCTPMDTEILTRRGWVSYGNVRVGEDETIGYKPETGRSEWTLIVGMHHYEDAELWEIGNGEWSAEVTPGHKWLTGAGLAETRAFTAETVVYTGTPLAVGVDVADLDDAERTVTGLGLLSRRRAEVFCPTTTLGTWTARQNGRVFLTGNSGRAIDFMGYEQDRLAQFFMNMRSKVLELIHTTSRGGYYITRGRRVASMGIQDFLHENHLHIAMRRGGLVPANAFGGVSLAGRLASNGFPAGISGAIRSYDRGGTWPSGTLGVNTSGRDEYVMTGGGMKEMIGLLRDLVERAERVVDAVERVAPGVGRELAGVSRQALVAARSR